MAISASYVSSSSFKIAGDRRVEFVPGRRVKADQGEDGTEFFTVKASSYNGARTLVETLESTVTANLRRVLYGTVAPGASGGLPVHDHSDEDQGGHIAAGGSDIERWRLWFGA